jgi:AcrR family transcriptional regulator
LTVYNQFGSRRGLIEAVFDDIALRGGIARLGDADGMADPMVGLDYIIDVFAAFWGSDAAIGRIHDAMAIDPEIAQALGERLERGRRLIEKLVLRLSEAGTPASVQRDTSDLIFTLTGFGVFRTLVPTRSTEQVRELVRAACKDALARLRPASTRR